MAATELQPGAGLRIPNPAPADAYYCLPQVGEAPAQPYASVAQACQYAPQPVRYDGLTVNVAGVEYWWKSADLSDAGLVVKGGGELGYDDTGLRGRVQSLETDVDQLEQDVTRIDNEVDTIQGLIPANATPLNRLATLGDIPQAQGDGGILYAGPGQATDGAMTQKSTTDALEDKVDEGDPRLSDARTPTAHTHPASEVTGLAPVATTGSYNSLTDKPAIPAGYDAAPLVARVVELEADVLQAENDLNALENEVAGHESRLDALEAQSPTGYDDTDIRNLLANKTNNATTAALSGRVADLERVLQSDELLTSKQDWVGLTPRAALLRLINEGSSGGTPTDANDHFTYTLPFSLA